MSYSNYELDLWERRRHILRGLFTEPPVLSPIPEHSFTLQTPAQESDDDIDLPALIVEKAPNRHDEPEQFYEALEVKMRRYYRRIFKGEEVMSDSDFDIYDDNATLILDLSASENDSRPPSVSGDDNMTSEYNIVDVTRDSNEVNKSLIRDEDNFIDKSLQENPGSSNRNTGEMTPTNQDDDEKSGDSENKETKSNENSNYDAYADNNKEKSEIGELESTTNHEYDDEECIEEEINSDKSKSNKISNGGTKSSNTDDNYDKIVNKLSNTRTVGKVLSSDSNEDNEVIDSEDKDSATSKNASNMSRSTPNESNGNESKLNDTSYNKSSNGDDESISDESERSYSEERLTTIEEVEENSLSNESLVYYRGNRSGEKRICKETDDINETSLLEDVISSSFYMSSNRREEFYKVIFEEIDIANRETRGNNGNDISPIIDVTALDRIEIEKDNVPFEEDATQDKIKMSHDHEISKQPSIVDEEVKSIENSEINKKDAEEIDVYEFDDNENAQSVRYRDFRKIRRRCRENWKENIENTVTNDKCEDIAQEQIKIHVNDNITTISPAVRPKIKILSDIILVPARNNHLDIDNVPNILEDEVMNDANNNNEIEEHSTDVNVDLQHEERAAELRSEGRLQNSDDQIEFMRGKSTDSPLHESMDISHPNSPVLELNYTKKHKMSLLQTDRTPEILPIANMSDVGFEQLLRKSPKAQIERRSLKRCFSDPLINKDILKRSRYSTVIPNEKIKNINKSQQTEGVFSKDAQTQTIEDFRFREGKNYYFVFF